MKKIKRKYRCPLCKKVVLRVSDKQWIKSICDSSGGKITRLILVTNGKKDTK